MEPLEIIAIIVGVIAAGLIGIAIGIFIIVTYLISPNGFVKDLTGNVYVPPKPEDPAITRVHIEALKNPEDMGRK